MQLSAKVILLSLFFLSPHWGWAAEEEKGRDQSGFNGRQGRDQRKKGGRGGRQRAFLREASQEVH